MIKNDIVIRQTGITVLFVYLNVYLYDLKTNISFIIINMHFHSERVQKINFSQKLTVVCM